MVNLKEIELIYNAIPTACLILHSDADSFTIVAANRAFLAITGTELPSLIGRSFFEVFPPNQDDDGSRTVNITNAFDHVLRHKSPHLVKRHRYDLPSLDGKEQLRYWDIETYPLLDENGQLQYIVQSSKDVTELVHAEQKLEANSARLKEELKARERAERALQLSNERYLYVNKATNDAIYDWDIDLDHIDWGDAFFNFYGFPKEGEFPLKKWAAMLHPEDSARTRESLQNALASIESNNWKEAYRLRRMNGTYAEVEENGYILRDENGKAKRLIGLIRDITAHKIAEVELESLKNTFSDLFQLNPLPMWVYDFQTLKFLNVNEAAVSHYGYTKEEFLKMSILDIRPEVEKADILESIRNEVMPGLSHTLKTRHLKKSGEEIIVSIRGNTIRYAEADARIVVAIDVTEKEKVERALVDSERRFKTLIQEGSDLIAILDPQGCYKYVSPTVERILEIKPDQLIGRDAFASIHESDKDMVFSQLRRLEQEKCVKLEPFRIIDVNGRMHWLETIITDMSDDSAINGVVVCNARVVSDRVEQELKIKEHLDRFNIVSKATSDAIWDMDYTTGHVLWNHGIKAVFGYDDLVVDYQWWYDRVHPEDLAKVTGVVKHNVEHKQSRWTSEYRFRCADGSYKFVLDRGFLIYDEHTGEVIKMIGALQDISERVAYTKAIEQHNRRLREIAWEQAHLVRGPLTNILGLMPLLKDSDNDGCSRESIMAYLDQAAEQLDATIREIISKSHQGMNASGRERLSYPENGS